MNYLSIHYLSSTDPSDEGVEGAIDFEIYELFSDLSRIYFQEIYLENVVVIFLMAPLSHLSIWIEKQILIHKVISKLFVALTTNF